MPKREENLRSANGILKKTSPLFLALFSFLCISNARILEVTSGWMVDSPLSPPWCTLVQAGKCQSQSSVVGSLGSSVVGSSGSPAG